MLLLLVSFAYCDAGKSEAADCTHVWEPYAQEIHGQIADEIVLSEVDPLFHVYMVRSPGSVCAVCGECEYSPGTGVHAYHSYEVKQWRCAETGDEVTISWSCRVCSYERTEHTTLQAIVQGTEANCLLGGKCDGARTGYMTDRQIITSGDRSNIVGEKEWFIALVYDPQAHTFLYASRDYCPLCGKPKIFAPAFATTVFNENWSGLPIMTEEYFLTVDMPDNLPYQLIDQLRKEAGAA